MRKGKLFFVVIPIILTSMLMSSCISINRQIKVNTDGSGKELLKITFMKEFYVIMSSMAALMDSTRRQGYLDSLYSDDVFQNKTVTKYDSVKGIKIINLSAETNEDSSKTFTIDYEFDSISKIGSSLSSINEDNDKYVTDVKFEDKGGNIYFLYEYKSKEDVIPGSGEDNDSLSVKMREGMSKMFENGKFDFEIEFPYEVISSNAVSQTGNTLKWEYPMKDVFLNNSLRLEAVLKK
ncbi:MAG: hypothetical protein JSS91_01600 [Bacteroidetes bacterium]|nr:hypothetical protein [Bacteroidota bacterium]